jgi:anti-sigma factor ChrR (cupin superfamily)
MFIKSGKERVWADTGIPGIESCAMWAGEGGDGGYLARLQAGARFPRHVHDGWEQILIVSGAVRFGDAELRSGDYLHAAGADEHDAQALEDTVMFVAHRGGIAFTEG